MIKSIKYGDLKQYFTSIHRFYRLSLNTMPQNLTFQSVLKQDNNASKADRSEDGFDHLRREEEKPSSRGGSQDDPPPSAEKQGGEGEAARIHQDFPENLQIPFKNVFPIFYSYYL